MPNETLKRTPLYESHLELKARMVPFAGYEMPVQYTGLLEEAKACRKQVGLFDVSHMGQFSVRGKNPLMAVQKLVTNDLSRLQLGQAQYNMLCNETGGVIDDLVIYHRTEGETFICVNASNRNEDYAWMKDRLDKTVTLEDQSDSLCLIAVQGPNAEALISALSDRLWIHHLKYYWAVEKPVAGIPCLVSRTGYTGEDGFELYVRNEEAVRLWNTLLEKGKSFGIVPCGLGARDTLRLEMGYPLHGHELSKSITPLEAGLSWVVKLQKEIPFIGQAALAKEATVGSSRQLKAFIVQDRRIARQGYGIFNSAGKQVGEITSGTHSPHIEAPVAMGFVEKASVQNETLFVEVRESKVPMKMTKLPFVPSKTKKI